MEPRSLTGPPPRPQAAPELPEEVPRKFRPFDPRALAQEISAHIQVLAYS